MQGCLMLSLLKVYSYTVNVHLLMFIAIHSNLWRVHPKKVFYVYVDINLHASRFSIGNLGIKSYIL